MQQGSATGQVQKRSETSSEMDVVYAELIAGCRAGERKSQELLYKKMYGVMMGICMRYTGHRDDALDALNQSFLKVFQRIHEFRGEGSFEGWVRRIVFTTVMDVLKSRVRFHEKHVFEDVDYAMEAMADVQLQAKDLMIMLQQLPETTRIIFNMFAIEGYKHQEIAKELGIQEGTSKWHVSEARKILKQKIQRYQEKNG